VRVHNQILHKISLTVGYSFDKNRGMRNWFKVVLLVVIVSLVSCGEPAVNQKHIDSFSMLPDFVVRKSGESKNSVTLFSFDVEKIRANIPYDGTEAHSAIINKLGLVTSRYYTKNQELGLLNPDSMTSLASCPYWNIQAFAPADGLRENISNAGFIEEIIGDGYLLTKDFEDNITADLAPVSCEIDNIIVQATTTIKLQKEVLAMMLIEEGGRVGDFVEVSEILQYMPEHQAVALVFSFEKFSEKAEAGTILGFYDQDQQYDMIPRFEIWGRPDGYMLGAIGSSVKNGIEHSTIVLLYENETIAKEDAITIQKVVLALPSMVDGQVWMDHMSFGKPIIKQAKNVVILDFDIKDRKKEDGLFSMQMLKFMDQMGDWGLFWRK
jgi:hypothetical protein